MTAWVEWTLTGTSLKRSGSFARRNGASACAHQDKVLTDASTLALEALPGAGRELARKISPYWRTQRLPLVADDDAPEAMYAVLSGHWSEALCTLAEGAKARPDSLEAQLNYGILLEGWGHHEHAAVQYDRASSLSSRGVVNRADRRNTKRMQEIARMTEAWAWTYAPGQPAPCTPPE